MSLVSSNPQPRAVYVKVSDKDIVKTHCNAGDTVNVDVDYYGVPVGVEVLGALSVTVDGVEVTPQASSAERSIDPYIVEVLRYVSAGRGYVDVEPYPDSAARIALGRLQDEGLL